MTERPARPRSPRLAAFLSLLFGYVGQIYAGDLRRAVALCGITMAGCMACLAILVGFPYLWVWIPVLVGMIGWRIYLVVDAYRLAKADRSEVLKPFQRVWCYVVASTAFGEIFIFCFSPGSRFVGDLYSIPTQSMYPTILAGEQIAVDFWSAWGTPPRQAVVTFHPPNSQFLPELGRRMLYVGRVIGLPGETIEVRDERVYIDGAEFDDPHGTILEEFMAAPQAVAYGPLKIPDDAVFILGDNRRRAEDSRFFGPVPLADLRGRVRMIYWSHPFELVFEKGTREKVQVPIRWDRIGTRVD